MKRQLITLDDIADFDNLARSAYLAARGKRTRPEVQRFFQHFEANIKQLADDIYRQRMPYGQYYRFTISDPKPRVIHAACFEDRVFHHAVIGHVGPLLERALTKTTYACRVGMGNHAAVKQVQRHLRRFPWYIKIDIQHYFDTIEHELLLQLLKRRLKGRDLFELLQRIIEGYHVTHGKGLPIGSLTSQHFANYYLDGLDRYILEQLPARAQIRYMDDVIWWCDSRNDARETLRLVCEYAEQERLLTVKPSTQINRSSHGVNFCGYRVTVGQLRLSRRRRRRYQQLRLHWEQAYLNGDIDSLELQRAMDAVHAITLPADSGLWRGENLRRIPPIDA